MWRLRQEWIVCDDFRRPLAEHSHSAGLLTPGSSHAAAMKPGIGTKRAWMEEIPACTTSTRRWKHVSMVPIQNDNLARRTCVPAAGACLSSLRLCAKDRAIAERICASWTTLDDAIAAAAGAWKPLGELLLAARRITSAQLDAALAEQRAAGGRLGALMIAKGWVSAREIALLLTLQERLAQARAARRGPARLGNLLVSRGTITERQLADAIEKQHGGRRIGEVLVDRGYAKPSEIDRGLKLQAAIASAALVAAISFLSALAMAPGPAVASSSVSETGAAASLDFAIRVPTFLRVSDIAAPRTLTIADADVARGYVDVPASTQMRVATNRRDGYLVTIEGRFEVVRSVRIVGMNRDVELDAQTRVASLRVPARASETRLDLGYRFVLAPNARPGNYPWPIALSAGSGP